MLSEALFVKGACPMAKVRKSSQQNRLQSIPRFLHYNWRTRWGTFASDSASFPDATSVVSLFAAIDPLWVAIQTYVGEKEDVVYYRDPDGFHSRTTPTSLFADKQDQTKGGV